MIMAKRLMIFNRFSYSCHIINSIYKVKVIVNLHGSLSEVLVLQCLVDLTQPNLIISILWWIFLHVFYFPIFIILRFLKKNGHLSSQFHQGLAPNYQIYRNLFAEKKVKWCFIEFVHKFWVKCQIGQVFTIPIKLML